MYTFKNTEQNNEKACDYETKSLLYLLCMRKDSKDINLLIVDCFNDITGGNDNKLSRLWDVQSKGVRDLRPKTIGKALATLYKNYLSKVSFEHYVLLMPKLIERWLIEEDLQTFNIENMKPKYITKVKEGLCEEHLRRTSEKTISFVDLNAFVYEVLFVIALDNKEEYTKNIIDFKNKDIKSKRFYEELFDEIRGRQSTLKNNCIEGIKIKSVEEVLELKRTIKREELEVLTINRLVGVDVFNKRSIPIEFLDELEGLDKEDKKDVIQKCNEDLSLTLFNKNGKKQFWMLIECIVQLVKENTELSSRIIYEKVPLSLIKGVSTLDEISCIYFISVIQEGLLW